MDKSEIIKKIESVKFDPKNSNELEIYIFFKIDGFNYAMRANKHNGHWFPVYIMHKPNSYCPFCEEVYHYATNCLSLMVQKDLFIELSKHLLNHPNIRMKLLLY